MAYILFSYMVTVRCSMITSNAHLIAGRYQSEQVLRLLYSFFDRQSERERTEDYQRQLNEMQERVGQRPLLFERARQVRNLKYLSSKTLNPL